MGLFSEIGKSIGFAGDIVGGIVATNRQKRGIDAAVLAEEQQIQENLNQQAALRDRLLGRVDPTIQRGERAAGTIEGILTGEQRLEPTAGERFATESALRGIDRASAGRKQILSGKRLEDFATRSAEIGSRFRQQDIENLDRLAGRGFQGIQVGQNAEFGVSDQELRLRELLGGVRSAGILGKTAADVGNIGNITSNFAKLQQSGGAAGDSFFGGF